MSAGLLVATVAPASAAAPRQVPQEAADAIAAGKAVRSYVVVMQGAPVAAYEGDTKGYPATRPQDGQKVDMRSSEARLYAAKLKRDGEAALKRAGASVTDRVYQYGVSLNGFAARLTPTEAAKLRADGAVVAVVEDTMRQLTTDSTGEFLGLTASPGGAWTRGVLGEDVVVGVIDSGIWPESESFRDLYDAYGPAPAGWAGICQTGKRFAARHCSDKLIGARFYADGYGADQIRAEFPEEFLSPRDADGHGTHTASTAAGNADTPTPFGNISGMAPRARIAAYKVCWGYSGAGGCTTSDSVAAIDQAVADGVDVINYSISGTPSEFLDPVELSFLFAADAGVIVNASAGNSGPAASTVNHPSPWVTTVAAGTEAVAFEAELTLGDGTVIAGTPSIANPGTSQLPLVYARNAPAAGVTADEAALCFEGSLDPATVSGRMVLCERGVIARTDKSAEVRRAGGLAMVLGNTSENSLNADAHVIPTIHVDDAGTAAVLAYLSSTAAPTAAQSEARTTTVPAPDVAAFSSRGPQLGSADLLKPDILAPGVDILAAYSPNIGGREFDYLSGTSMSSPHMAGLSALVREVHPDWSAAMVKSALMTTATTTRTDGTPIAGGPFAYGSGLVQPNDALEPGLVYDADFYDHLGFMCGVGQLAVATCDAFGAVVIDPSDLNQPNIAVGELAGSQTVTRTITNVSGARRYFKASVQAPAGVAVSVTPSTVRLRDGESADVQVRLTTKSGAAIGETVFGTLMWKSGRLETVSQLVVTPTKLAAPAEVSSTELRGSTTYQVGFGYSGAFTVAAHGMEKNRQTRGTVVDDPSNDVNTALASGVGVTFHTISVPSGGALSRFSLFDADTDGEDDLDLYVFGPDGGFVGSSGSGTSAEEVNVSSPAPGKYTVIVHGWQTDGPDASYTLSSWTVKADPSADDGSLSVTGPSSASLGEMGDVTASWRSLQRGRRWLGAVSYRDGGGVFGLTVVSVDTTG